MTIVEKKQMLLDELGILPDPYERFSLIVERGKSAGLSDVEKVSENEVPGCISTVWLVGERKLERWHFRCDADAPMVLGLVACLAELYDGATASEIRETEPTLFEDLGIFHQLSPTRKNGLNHMRKRILEIVGD